MKYLEYLSSAKRHSLACRTLQEKIETYGSNNRDDDKYKFLVISLYYLSGYIIECSLKFKILEASGFNTDLEVTHNECLKIGINYNREIKIHDFGRLQNALSSRITNISYDSDDCGVCSLLSQWNPIIRYQDTNLEYQEVKAFYNHANCFLRKM